MHSIRLCRARLHYNRNNDPHRSRVCDQPCTSGVSDRNQDTALLLAHRSRRIRLPKMASREEYRRGSPTIPNSAGVKSNGRRRLHMKPLSGSLPVQLGRNALSCTLDTA